VRFFDRSAVLAATASTRTRRNSREAVLLPLVRAVCGAERASMRRCLQRDFWKGQRSTARFECSLSEDGDSGRDERPDLQTEVVKLYAQTHLDKIVGALSAGPPLTLNVEAPVGADCAAFLGRAVCAGTRWCDGNGPQRWPRAACSII